MTHTHHDPEPSPEAGKPAGTPAAQPPRPMDPAQKSLAEALRVSFRILTVIMIIMVFVYLFTGVAFIEPQQVGIRKVFGREVGTAREGLTYNWPFPIGQIEKVSTKEQELTIDDFWMHETAADKTKTLSARSSSAKALRPGWDGALLTGDRNLLHVRLSCTYSIRRPVAYRRYVRDRNLEEMPHLREMVRSVICRAAIRAAARRTADAIQRAEQEGFKKDVKDLAQEELNILLDSPPPEEAVQISQVLLKEASWPLKALGAYTQAQQASNDKDTRISAAKAEAGEILNTTCGPKNVRKLVGDPLSLKKPGQPTTAPSAGGQAVDLIGRYAKVAGKKGQEARARALLQQIDEILVGADTTGAARRTLEEAESDRTAIKQDAQRRAQRFQTLVKEYRRAPQFMLARHWARTLDEILSAPTVSKFYLPLGKGKTIIRMNPDPDIERGIQREGRKKDKEKREQPK